MAKRKDILQKISKAAKAADLTFEFEREGANHTIYNLDGYTIPVGRHNELGDRYAETIYKECEQKLGKGWWR